VIEKPEVVSKMGDGDAGAIRAKADEAGVKVRTLKAEKASKGDIDAAVKVLLDLKKQYKELTGEEYQAAAAPGVTNSPAPRKEKENKKPQQQAAQPKLQEPANPNLKKQTRLGLEAKKNENLPDWYSQVRLFPLITRNNEGNEILLVYRMN